MTITRRRPPRGCLAIACLLLVCFLSGCGSELSVHEQIETLSSKLNNEVKQLQTSRTNLAEIKAKYHAISSSNRLLAIDRQNKNNRVALGLLSKDSDSQNIALARLNTTYTQRNDDLVPVVNELNELEKSHAQQDLQSMAAIHNQPDRLHLAEQSFGMRFDHAAEVADSPIWSTVRSIFSRKSLWLWTLLIGITLFIWGIIRFVDLPELANAKRWSLEHEMAQSRTNSLDGKSGKKRKRAAKSRIKYPLHRRLVVNKILCGVAVGLAIILTSLASTEVSESAILFSYRDRLEADVAEVSEQNKHALQQIESLTAKLVQENRLNNTLLPVFHASLAERLVGPPPNHNDLFQPPVRMSLITTHKQSLNHVGQLDQTIERLHLIGENIQADLAAAEAQELKLEAFQTTMRAHRERLLWAKGGIVLAFALINISLVTSWNRRRRTRDRRGELCARCLAPLDWPKKSKPGDDHQVTCTSCNQINESVNRLTHTPRIPLAGHPHSGKTQWLTALLDRLDSQQVKSRARLTVAPETASDDYFIEPLKKLRKREATPDATTPEYKGFNRAFAMPFKDGHTPFSAAGRLYLYDTAGEVFSERGNDSPAQVRAFQNANGFCYFIDPTTNLGEKQDDDNDKKKLSLEECAKLQAKYLANFARQVRDKRGKLTAGQTVPLAVCITKIDMNPDSSDTALSDDYEKFTTDLGSLWTADPSIRLSTIRERHHICQQYLAHIFPYWNITEELKRIAGNNFMFFPMTSWGYRPESEQSQDLKSASLESRGISEPLLWLMHMNGYKAI